MVNHSVKLTNVWKSFLSELFTEHLLRPSVNRFVLGPMVVLLYSTGQFIVSIDMAPDMDIVMSCDFQRTGPRRGHAEKRARPSTATPTPRPEPAPATLRTTATARAWPGRLTGTMQPLLSC